MNNFLTSIAPFLLSTTFFLIFNDLISMTLKKELKEVLSSITLKNIPEIKMKENLQFCQ